MANKFKLGTKLECRVSGFKGIAVARCEYLNGCIQYGIKPKVGKNGEEPDAVYVDEGQLKQVGKGITTTPKKTGGPQRDCPKT